MLNKKISYLAVLFLFLCLFYGCLGSEASSINPAQTQTASATVTQVNNSPVEVASSDGTAEELAKKGYDYWMTGEHNNYDEAIDCFNRAIEKDPENGEYYGALGRILFDLGDEEKALVPLEKSLELSTTPGWTKAWSHIMVGQIYEMKKDYDKALKNYEEALALKATENSNIEASGRITIIKNWKRTETDHFIFNYPPGGYGEENISSIIDKYEKSYTNISKFLQTEVPGKIIYYLFPSREEGKKIIGYELGFSHPANNQIYALMGKNEQQTVGHEMTHVISFYIAPTVNSDVLIHEGLAEYQNQEGEDFHGEVAYLLKNGAFVSLKDLRKDFRSYDTQLAYNEAASFVKYLIDTYGLDKFKKVWAREDIEKAFTEIYGKSCDEIGTEWEEIIKNTEPVEWNSSSEEEINEQLEEDLKFLYDPNFPFNEGDQP